MNDEQFSVGQPVVKVVSAWAIVGISSWADAAAAAATLYTLLLICEWGWKNFVRAFCVRRGWLK